MNRNTIIVSNADQFFKRRRNLIFKYNLYFSCASVRGEKQKKMMTCIYFYLTSITR